MNPIKYLKGKCNSKLTDIVGGPMNLGELNLELISIMGHRSPEYMVILIEKDRKLKKYISTIYITKKDFEKYK